MMRILAGYVDMHPATDAALRAYAPMAERVNMSHSPHAYWQNIADRWQGKDDLMIVEQDVEIREGVVESFEACPEPWCCYWYQGPPISMLQGADGYKARAWGYDDRMTKSLGCTRYRKELQLAVPHTAIADYKTQLWDTIDTHISPKLEEVGFSPHCHGQVRHHHQYLIIYLDPPTACSQRRYTWRHVSKGGYPTHANNEYFRPTPIPPNAETVLIDCSKLEGEE